LEHIEKFCKDPGTKNGARRFALAQQLRAQAFLGRAADAQRTLAAIETAVQPVEKQAFMASLRTEARGLAKFAAGDIKGAVGELQGCLTVEPICQSGLIRLQEKAGEVAAAAATRERLFGTPTRGNDFVYIWHALGGKPAAKATTKSG